MDNLVQKLQNFKTSAAPDIFKKVWESIKHQPHSPLTPSKTARPPTTSPNLEKPEIIDTTLWFNAVTKE